MPFYLLEEGRKESLGVVHFAGLRGWAKWGVKIRITCGYVLISICFKPAIAVAIARSRYRKVRDNYNCDVGVRTILSCLES